jgi:hypothetical protein
MHMSKCRFAVGLNGGFTPHAMTALGVRREKAM